ncbi:hypothetical protein B0A54_04006 [Friedmanniomyces endolithicus]|uniref:SNF2 N-terminal domain-containing protein n=1 Tax=Friedmanniomyces endolithicus TaxID=329885 RepID=A0A4U0V9F8_9PEZI|nr:hypothetical protein B0A54_04006 [Friedmanniomyces endolithicus]
MTVGEILQQGVEPRWEAFRKTFEVFDALKTGTDSEPRGRGLLEQLIFEKRQSAVLHSGAYHQLGRSIRCMILDEGHLIKNEKSSTYDALRSINARFVFTLTGALLVNRWMDAFKPISFLKNHPFDTREKFSRALSRGDVNSQIAEPSATKENRLVKFLQGVSRGRHER